VVDIAFTNRAVTFCWRLGLAHELLWGNLLYLCGKGVKIRICQFIERKGGSMAKNRDKKEVRRRARSQLRSSAMSVRMEPCEQLRLSERESKLLGELWDGQKISARSKFAFRPNQVTV
jgi:hypothetical protein